MQHSIGNYAAPNRQLCTAASNKRLSSTQWATMQHLTEGLVPLLVAVASHGASHGKTLHLIVALANLGVRFGLSKSNMHELRFHTCCAFPLSSVEEQGEWPRRPKGLLRILPSLSAATSDVRRRRRRVAVAGALIERRLGGCVVGPLGMPTVLGRLWRRTRSPPHKLKPPTRLPSAHRQKAYEDGICF